jgi:hypothetical protein
MARDPEFFVSGEVTIEATIEHCQFMWPATVEDLESDWPEHLSFDSLWQELPEYVAEGDVSVSHCQITAIPSWKGVTFSARACVDIRMDRGEENANATRERDAQTATLPERLVSALRDDDDNFGLNNPSLSDVTPIVRAEWVGQSIRVTVEVAPTLRAWTEPVPSLEEAIVGECDLSSVPPRIRRKLGVTKDRVPWDSIDITDESSARGIGYSATATVCLELEGSLSDEDEEELRNTLDGDYGSLMANFEHLNWECDDGGFVTVDVQQEFDDWDDDPDDSDDDTDDNTDDWDDDPDEKDDDPDEKDDKSDD